MRYSWRKPVRAVTNKMNGFKKVYKFSVQQLFKSKANIASLIILAVVAFLYIPFITLIMNGTMAQFDSNSDYIPERTICDKLYVMDRSDIGLNKSEVICSYDDILSDVQVVFGESPDSSEFPQIEITESGGKYTVKVSGDVPGEAVSSVYDYINEKVIGNSDIPSQALDIIQKQRNITSSRASDLRSADVFEMDESLYMTQIIFSVVVMMISIMSAGYIIRSVTEEKASKLVEMLMINIEPEPLMAGKIFASLTYSLVMMAVMGVSVFTSVTVFGMFLDLGSLGEMMGFSSVSAGSLGAVGIICAIVSVILGIIAFSLISGLVGAGCSSMEDTGSAMGVPMLIIMGCYIISMSASMMKTNIVLCLIPFLSSFITPIQFLSGNIGFPIIGASWLIQILVIVLLLIVSSKVYRNLLIYNGSRIKLGKIISMAFAGRRGK